MPSFQTIPRLLAAFLLVSGSASLMAGKVRAAEEFGPFVYDQNRPEELRLSGWIDSRSALNFRRALAAHPEINRLFLDSAGGFVQVALLIANDVYRAGIETIIERSSRCYSSCAFIFFAGTTRLIDGQLGVHQISAGGKADEQAVQLDLSDIVEAINRFGIDPRVLQYMLRTTYDDIYIFRREEIVLLNIEKVATGITKEPMGTASIELPRQISELGFGEGLNVEDVDIVLELGRYAENSPAGADGEASYTVAIGKTDLNGDKQADYVVQVEGAYFCGNGGCAIDVFMSSGQRLLQAGTFLGHAVALDTTSRSGVRNIVVDGRRTMVWNGSEYEHERGLTDPGFDPSLTLNSGFWAGSEWRTRARSGGNFPFLSW